MRLPMKLPMICLICFGIWLQSLIAFAGVLASPMQVVMRNHGYTIGDTIDMYVSITLQKGQTLDMGSIPLNGPVSSWLDLREVRITQDVNARDESKINIKLTWQIFATVVQTQMLKTPAIALKTLAKKPIHIIIPAQGFYMSSVLPQQLPDSGHRPFIPPTKLDTATPLLLAALCFLAALICGVVWIWLGDQLPWWPRKPGPIALLERKLRAYPLVNSQQFDWQELRLIHTALADSAGETLYPNTLERLYQKCPYLLSRESDITQFFQQSWMLIFESSQDSKISRISVQNTLQWIHDAALSERLFRRESAALKHKTNYKLYRV